MVSHEGKDNWHYSQSSFNSFGFIIKKFSEINHSNSTF